MRLPGPAIVVSEVVGFAGVGVTDAVALATIGAVDDCGAVVVGVACGELVAHEASETTAKILLDTVEGYACRGKLLVTWFRRDSSTTGAPARRTESVSIASRRIC